MIGGNLDKCPYCGSVVDVAVDHSVSSVDGLVYSGTDSDQTPLAYRFAASILLLGTLIGLAEVLVSIVAGDGISTRSIISLIIDAGLVIALFRLDNGARKWVLWRVALGVIIYPAIIYAESRDVLSLVIVIVVQLAYSGSLILMLTGKSKPWRFIVAGAVFMVFGFLPMLVILVLYILTVMLW